MSSVQRKHILIMSSWYPTPEHPFLGNFVQRQAEVLATMHDVTVLHTVPEENRKEIEITEKSVNGVHETFIYHPKGTHFLSRRNNRLKALEKGFKSIQKPDLIHGHVLIPGGYLFVRAKEYFKCPLVVTEHASYYRPERKNKLSLKEKYVLQQVRRHADRIIAVSDFLKKDMQDLFNGNTIQVIGNPVDTELFRPSHLKQRDFSYFLHVSTLDAQLKNIDGLLEAVALLVQKGYEEVKLKILSDELYEEWEEKTASLELSPYVEFSGPYTHEELVPFFQEASAFVLFSRYETFSIVLAEAMSCGIPVISTPVGIAAELPSTVGLLVKDNDALSLAMAMEKVLNDIELDAMTIRKHALAFSDVTILEQLNALYQEFNG
jgi:L-malate glycosyltransferase